MHHDDGFRARSHRYMLLTLVVIDVAVVVSDFPCCGNVIDDVFHSSLHRCDAVNAMADQLRGMNTQQLVWKNVGAELRKYQTAFCSMGKLRPSPAV